MIEKLDVETRLIGYSPGHVFISTIDGYIFEKGL